MKAADFALLLNGLNNTAFEITDMSITVTMTKNKLLTWSKLIYFTLILIKAPNLFSSP